MRGRAARWLILVALLLVGACSSGAPPSQPPTPGAGQAPRAPGTASAPAPSPTVPQSAMRFRVAATQPAPTSAYLLPYWVGIDAGTFRQHGIALELVTLQNETVALAAAANGEVDVVLGTPGPILLATLAGGIDALILGATHNAFDQRLLAASDVEKPADLIGKTVVISEKGTLNEWHTREALQRIGVDFDRELAGFWSGANQAERLQNLRLGNGQGTVVPPPLSVSLAREGFTDFGDLSEGPPWPGVAMFMARRVYATRQDHVQRFLRGLVASIQRTKADPVLAKQALAKYTRVEDPEGVEEAYAVYGDRLLERVPRISREGLQRAYDVAVDARAITRRLALSTLVDETLLQRLESSGFVDELYR
jgi:ABC-type nitrate/sulfonate/bicarbonate transport system substrate-binding protein